MSVRLYGRAQGHGSHAQVTAGFRLALEAEGLLEGFVPHDLSAIDDEVLREDDSLVGHGTRAKHGVFTGALGSVELMMRAAHERRWVMVAPNSTELPPALVRVIARVATDLLTPSRWAAEQLRRHFELPIHFVPHGVMPAFKPWRATRSGEEQFRVLHFSTSERQRKGTLELVRAWRLAHLPGNAACALVLDHDAMVSLLEHADEELAAARGLHMIERRDFDARNMAMFLCQADLVCQPSRGEAFGCIPLEALCCGIPIAATLCTGHSEYLSRDTPGCTPIYTGDLAPIDDLPGALAPELKVSELAASLNGAYYSRVARRAEAQAAADALSEKWQWEKQLAPWMGAL